MSLFSKLTGFFGSGKAQKALDTAANYMAEALPYIDIGEEIIAGINPIAGAMLVTMKTDFPGLYDGSIKTGKELRIYALGVTTELMKSRYPALSTTLARAALQMAYTGKTAQ